MPIHHRWLLVPGVFGIERETFPSATTPLRDQDLKAEAKETPTTPDPPDETTTKPPDEA